MTRTLRLRAAWRGRRRAGGLRCPSASLRLGRSQGRVSVVRAHHPGPEHWPRLGVPGGSPPALGLDSETVAARRRSVTAQAVWSGIEHQYQTAAGRSEYVCACLRVGACLLACSGLRACMRACVRVRVCVCARARAYVCALVRKCVCACVRARARMCAGHARARARVTGYAGGSKEIVVVVAAVFAHIPA